MVEVLNALICKNCEAILKYEKNDIKIKKVSYPVMTYKDDQEIWSYEEGKETFIICPRCNNEVKIIW